MSSPKDPTRREFLTVGSAAALAAAAAAVGAQANALPLETANLSSAPAWSDDPFHGQSQRTFSGETATQVAMPLGGIGAGCICLNGYGGLQDFSIRTRPETSSLPEGFTSDSPEAGFALLHIKGAGSAPGWSRGHFRSSRFSIRDCKARDCDGEDLKVSRDSPKPPFADSTRSAGWTSTIPSFRLR